MKNREKLLPAKQVQERFGVCAMTLWRWEHDESLTFPAPVRIRSRKYWREEDLHAFEQRQLDVASI